MKQAVSRESQFSYAESGLSRSVCVTSGLSVRSLLHHTSLSHPQWTIRINITAIRWRHVNVRFRGTLLKLSINYWFSFRTNVLISKRKLRKTRRKSVKYDRYIVFTEPSKLYDTRKNIILRRGVRRAISLRLFFNNFKVLFILFCS